MCSPGRRHALLALSVLIVGPGSGCGGLGEGGQRGSITTADGVRLSYLVRGAGPDTAIVLHGGPALDDRYMEDAFAGLEAGHTLIFYDQRGRGNSSPPLDSTALSLQADLRDLELVRQHFGVERPALIAHHWGALLAALYARNHPDHVSRLVLVSPWFPRSSFLFSASTLPNDTTAGAAYAAALAVRQDSTDPAAFCRSFWGYTFVPLEVTDRASVRALAPAMCAAPPEVLRARELVQRVIQRSAWQVNMQDSLAALPMPVLVIHGDEDHPFVRSSMLAWVRWLPDARLLDLPGPGLLPWLGDRPEFLRESGRFLRGQWPERAQRADSVPTPSAATGPKP